MKIDRVSPNIVPDAYRTQTQRPGSAQAPTTPPVPAADAVTLSSRSRDANTMRTKLKSAPDVRADLVAKIKAQVEAGEYNIEPKQVAERILRSKVLDE